MLPNVLLTSSPFAESLVARWTDLAAGWLLTYLVHSTVILLVAWLVTSRARVSDAVREVVWKCALVGGLVTASVQTAVARAPLAGQLRLAPRTASPATEMRVSLRSNPPHSAERFFVARPRGLRWSAGLVVLWLTGSGAGLLWLTVGHARTLRVLADRTSLDGTPVAARLRALLSRSQVRRRVVLTCSGSIASPVALSGDEVCLPRRALFELTPNEQDGMLAHEVAHLVRRDPQWLVVARAIEIVLFMQPLNRLARHRMQEVAEFLCDDWAVSRMRQPVTLAKCLAAVAEWVRRAPRMQVPRLSPTSAMVESSASPLVRRVGRILSARTATRARTPRLAFVASAGALVAFMAIAPRVSVAHATLTDRTVTFVREITDGSGAPRRDSMFVFRTRRVGIAVDSLVRQPSGVMAGPLGNRAQLIVIEQRTDR
jgi:beta-lactamase regulating signal transducer with metallopeptidase domain